jgi:hypothetical protein
MADVTLFGAIAARVPSGTFFGIYKVLTNGTVSPEVIFNAANPVPHNFTVFGFEVWNNTGGAQAGATATLQSNLNNLGLVAISDALAFALNDSKAIATTIDPAQAALTVGNATEDILNIAKNANTDAGIAMVVAFAR